MSRKEICLRPRVALSVAMAAALCLAAASSHAQTKPKAAVVLGDSFSSGEAGRWSGNSFTGIDGGNRAGTDGAAFQVAGKWDYSTYLHVPYEWDSVRNGCNRSNSAPITYLQKHANQYPQGFDKVFNFACSGAKPKHLWPISAGGAVFKGESPQIPRLATAAATHDIDLIVVGIGGNDMGFGEAVKACVAAWARKHWTPEDGLLCIDEIKKDHLPKLGNVWFNTAKTIHEVRKQMQAIGDHSYRIVLMGYPAIIPRGNGYAYDAGMRRIRNCPFNGPDSDFIDDVLLPKLNSTLEAVAHQEGVDFINPHHAFNGHRLCESGLGGRMTGAFAPTSLNTEWVRYLDTTIVTLEKTLADIGKWAGLFDGVIQDYIAGTQGSLAESMHPNKFGQQAIGDCLREYRAAGIVGTDRGLRCTPGPSGYASDMRVSFLPSPSMIHVAKSVAIPAQGSIKIHRSVIASNEPGKTMRTELKIIHPRKGHLKITMRSPSGKTYLIRDINPNDTGAQPAVAKNFFYDAPAESGNWTLTIEDKIAGYAGTFQDWKAYFY